MSGGIDMLTTPSTRETGSWASEEPSTTAAVITPVTVEQGAVALPQRSAWSWALIWGVRVVLAGLFVLAASSKIADPAAFAKAVHRYQLLPESFVQPLAIWLPWLEVVAAVALVMVSPWRRAAGWLLAGLLVVFSTAAASAWARGLAINCGCFSSDPEAGAVGPMLFVRNAALLAGLFLLIWSDGRWSRTSRRMASA